MAAERRERAGRTRQAGRPERRFEPWPIALAGALLAMIGVSVAFWIVAVRNPDVELLREGGRPGLVAPGPAEDGRAGER